MSKKFIIPALAFMLLASPASYKFGRNITAMFASADGLPTNMGVLLHALFFVILVTFLMKMSRSSGFLSEVVDSQYYAFSTRDDADDQDTRHFEEVTFMVPQ